MNNEFRAVARRLDLVVQRSDDEILVYDLRSNEAMCLNASSASVWERCDGTRSPRDIAHDLSRKLKTPVSEEFVDLALSELARHELLTNAEYPENRRVSRRQLIRRVGMASMIGLPLVASMVAPQAALAQSCTANNSSCTLSAQCCSNCCKNVSPGANQCKPGGGACLP